MLLTTTKRNDSCFDDQIQRAIELAKAGYAVTQVAQLIMSECSSPDRAHLVARAAQTFVKMMSRQGRRGVVWI